MVRKALFVRVEAKPGKELEVETFLKELLNAVNQDEDTIDWFALKFGTSSYAIFDTFPHDSARLQHLAGKVGRALISKAPALLTGVPRIEHADVLATKHRTPAALPRRSGML